MSFEIRWTPVSRKSLRKLPSNISKKIVQKIYALSDNPFRYLKHFEGEGYKLRIGDYRALIDVDFVQRVLIVRVLDKRGRIYKR